MNNDTPSAKVQVGFILDSTKVFDEYLRATGKLPPPIPPGTNTLRTEFEIELDGVKRAAMLIKQRGFEQTAEERARCDEVNGLSLAIATDVDLETGKAVLREISAKLLWPNDGEEQ